MSVFWMTLPIHRAMLWRNLNCDGWNPGGWSKCKILSDERSPWDLTVPLPCHPNIPCLPGRGSVPVLTGMDATSSCCGSCRGFWEGLCAAKIQLLSGRVQPGFPLFPSLLWVGGGPAITILGQSLESVHWVSAGGASWNGTFLGPCI